jgi:hypothetical protein
VIPGGGHMLNIVERKPIMGHYHTCRDVSCDGCKEIPTPSREPDAFYNMLGVLERWSAILDADSAIPEKYKSFVTEARAAIGAAHRQIGFDLSPKPLVIDT